MIPKKLWPLASLLALAGAGLVVLSCGGHDVSPPPQARYVEAVRAVLLDRLGPPGSGGPVYCRRDRLCGSDVLPGFYRARNSEPAWIDDDLELAQARAYVAALRGVADDGLDPENYHLSSLEALIRETDEARRADPASVSSETLADLEMLLTDSFLLCGSQLVHGQVNPETVESEWHIKGRVEDLAATLEKGIAGRDISGALDSLRPRLAVYRGLREAYRDYRDLAKSGGWEALPPGPKLKAGDRGPRVEALRKSLEARDDLSLSEDPGRDVFDGRLEEALKVFERRHGLPPDGVLGDAVTAALNVPVDRRLTQIRANLERWRWVSPDMGDRYILIRVADFRLSVYEKGEEVLTMPIIVGRAYRRTPDFSARLKYVEINPYWSVPTKLARQDILPLIKKDPDYCARMGMRVFEGWGADAREIDPASVDWSRIGPGDLTYHFRQDPGLHNALGRIAFRFPNKYDVYMHDTPERQLFERTVRDFSSGCIRLSRPMDLAVYVLRDDPQWTRDGLQAGIDSLRNRLIPVPEELGVHLIYWTAWRDGLGLVNFRDDIYGRDATLIKALAQKVSSPAGD
jgi:murein L,D-transpeptidase YcbB/YkuD